ncbi:MAG TPA: alpha/beta hydrolase domain-containing protein, partial [Acidimicrobiia bacterium]|nr:alpha/beta hydrolase domain-containing protein [Acidimicrobiia bacterium]
SGSGDSDEASEPAATTTTPSTIARPAGPVADLSEEISGGNGMFLPSGNSSTALTAPEPPEGYVANEYVAAGTATSYKAKGELAQNGEWTFAPDGEAKYRTRVAVRRPEKAEDFSGTVIFEWLNVSGGVDSAAEYDTTYEEIARAGHAWVGISAQLIGVEGGRVAVKVPEPGGTNYAGQGIKKLDPERYGSLVHPGDGFGFDIFTQVARAVRQGGEPLGGLQPQRVIAAGESQSAAALVTYFNGVQPLTEAFDGFFVHSRGAGPLPLAQPGQAVGIVDSIGRNPTLVRADQDAPIIDIQAENDTGILRSLTVRQPDTEKFRLWEMAGTAHADARLLGSVGETTLDCGLPVNKGPMHLIAKAALHALDEWVRTGTPPPSAPRFETTGDTDVKRDADGIVLGGIRSPMLDTPVDVLSGVPGPAAQTVCILSGSTKPLSEARLAELYSSRAEYVEQYDADTDKAIAAGHLLEGDREAIIAYSQPDRIGE